MSQPNIKEKDSEHSYSVDDSIYKTVVESYDDLVFLIQNNRTNSLIQVDVNNWATL